MVRAATVRRHDDATTGKGKIPQKSPDSTEESLTAIREASDTSHPERRAAPPVTPTGESDLAQTKPSATADLFNEEPQPGTWDSDSSLTRRAANDDRASLGQMLQAIHGRPARMPYIVASVAAFIWTAGGLATAYLYGGE